MAVAEIVAVDGAWVHLRYGDDAPAAIPERAYLYDVRDTDPADPHALVALAGRLRGDLVPVQRERWRDVVSPPRGEVQANPLGQYSQVLSGPSEALGLGALHLDDLAPRAPAQRTRRPRPDTIEDRVHFAELAVRVWSLQAVTAAVTGQIPVQASPWGKFDSTFPAPPAYVTAEWLAGKLAQMLHTFSPHVVLQLPGEDAHGGRPGQPSTALEVAALQLHNDLVRDQGWRRCPRCARVFVRQRGRARYPATQSHRREDAIYCSGRCAKAAAQAAYRRRQRAAAAMDAAQKGRDR